MERVLYKHKCIQINLLMPLLGNGKFEELLDWSSICVVDHELFRIHFTPLQSRTGPVQGQNRDFPVYFSHTGKNLFSLQGSQVIETGFSLFGKVHREFPVFITGMGLQCVLIRNPS